MGKAPAKWAAQIIGDPVRFFRRAGGGGNEPDIKKWIVALAADEVAATPVVIDELCKTRKWQAGGGDRLAIAREVLIEARTGQFNRFICAVAHLIDLKAIDAKTANIVASAAYQSGAIELGLRALHSVFRIGSDEEKIRWLRRYEEKFTKHRLSISSLYWTCISEAYRDFAKALSGLGISEPNANLDFSSVRELAMRAASDIRNVPTTTRVPVSLGMVSILNSSIATVSARALAEDSQYIGTCNILVQLLSDDLERAIRDDRLVLSSNLGLFGPVLVELQRRVAGHESRQAIARMAALIHYFKGETDQLAHLLTRFSGLFTSDLYGALLAYSAAAIVPADRFIDHDIKLLPPPIVGLEGWIDIYLAAADPAKFVKTLVAGNLTPEEKNRKGTYRKVLRELMSRWRPDACVGFLKCELTTWSDGNLVALATALIFCGHRREAERIVMEAFERQPRSAQLAKFLKGVGLGARVDRSVSEVREELRRGRRPVDQKETTALVEFLVEALEFDMAHEVIVLSAPNDLPIWRTKRGVKYLANATNHKFAYWEARLLEMTGREREAVHFFSLLRARDPKSLGYAEGIARCLFELGRFDEALEQLKACRSDIFQTGANFSLTLHLILIAKGLLREAFDHYRRRPLTGNVRNAFGPVRYPEEGSPMPERGQSILIISEGGPGDEIRFATLLPELLKVAGPVTATCDPRLESIMRRSFPEIEFIPVRRHRREFLAEVEDDMFQERSRVGNQALAMVLNNTAFDRGMKCDRVAWITDLRSDLRPNLEAFPQLGAYLKIAPETEALWRQRLRQRVGGKIAVGLCWRSLLESAARSRHYSNLADWEDMFRAKEVAVVNLQPGLSASERQYARDRGWNLIEFDDLDLTNDFENSGGLIRALDWVVAPCTSTLEFAGALGVRSILISRSEQLAWRQRADGTDIWHSSVLVDLPYRDSSFRPEARRIMERIRNSVAACAV